MKKFIGVLAACLMALPLGTSAQTYVAQSGVSLFTAVPATATSVSGPVRLPNFSGAGTLTVTESGITGSPSGCTVALAYQGNNATVATSAVSTTSFTPASNVQQFVIAPSIATGDNYVATFHCSAYPTAGLLTASFSPAAAATVITSGTISLSNAAGTDPCANPSVAKSSAVVNISGAAGTTQLVAVSGTTSVYACGFQATVVGTTPTVLFEYGTSTDCTGTHALTGTMAIVTTSTVNLGFGGSTVFKAPASQGLCLVAGGTTPSIQGVLTYVQQ